VTPAWTWASAYLLRIAHACTRTSQRRCVRRCESAFSVLREAAEAWRRSVLPHLRCDHCCGNRASSADEGSKDAARVAEPRCSVRFAGAGPMPGSAASPPSAQPEPEGHPERRQHRSGEQHGHPDSDPRDAAVSGRAGGLLARRRGDRQATGDEDAREYPPQPIARRRRHRTPLRRRRVGHSAADSLPQMAGHAGRPPGRRAHRSGLAREDQSTTAGSGGLDDERVMTVLERSPRNPSGTCESHSDGGPPRRPVKAEDARSPESARITGKRTVLATGCQTETLVTLPLAIAEGRAR
jgi:hypothetical protein